MQRRTLLKLMGAGATATMTRLAEAHSPGSPLRLPAGGHLFIDNYLIARQSNLTRLVTPPTRHEHPVVTGKEDANFQPYLTVLRDEQTHRFRMWYDVAVSGGQSHLGYLESDDGVNWIRPHRVLDDPAKIVFGASVIDEGPAFAAPSARFKLAWWNQGMWIANSGDGITWKPVRPAPVLTGINDILSLTIDPYRHRYLSVFGFPSSPADGYKGKTQNSREGYRRCVGMSTSKDGVAWEPPTRIVKPDDKDEGITEFYSIGGMIGRGGLIVGLLKVLRDDLPCEPDGPVHGLGYTVLAWTRDGEHWERDRAPFLDRNPQPHAWDRAMTWGDAQLVVGDEVFIYYGGYARGHKVERFTERQIGLAKMKRDRYVARAAGEAQGTLQTPLITFEAKAMTLNVDARGGEVRVQVTDDEGKPMRGFAFADCAPITIDSLNAPVKWKGALSLLKGKPVQLEFALHRARLYAFTVE